MKLQRIKLSNFRQFYGTQTLEIGGPHRQECNASFMLRMGSERQPYSTRSCGAFTVR